MISIPSYGHSVIIEKGGKLELGGGDIPLSPLYDTLYIHIVDVATILEKRFWSIDSSFYAIPQYLSSRSSFDVTSKLILPSKHRDFLSIDSY